jgi:hypothetical protein
MLPLAKQSLDEATYKLSKAVAKLVGITFSRLSLSYWIDNLGFITEGKLAAIFIKTFSWGFPTGRSFYFINSAPSKRIDVDRVEDSEELGAHSPSSGDDDGAAFRATPQDSRPPTRTGKRVLPKFGLDAS